MSSWERGVPLPRASYSFRTSLWSLIHPCWVLFRSAVVTRCPSSLIRGLSPFGSLCGEISSEKKLRSCLAAAAFAKRLLLPAPGERGAGPAGLWRAPGGGAGSEKRKGGFSSHLEQRVELWQRTGFDILCTRSVAFLVLFPETGSLAKSSGSAPSFSCGAGRRRCRAAAHCSPLPQRQLGLAKEGLRCRGRHRHKPGCANRERPFGSTGEQLFAGSGIPAP